MYMCLLGFCPKPQNFNPTLFWIESGIPLNTDKRCNNVCAKSYWAFRQRAAGVRVQVQQGGDDRLRPNKAIPAPDANAELPASIQVPCSSPSHIVHTFLPCSLGMAYILIYLSLHIVYTIISC